MIRTPPSIKFDVFRSDTLGALQDACRDRRKVGILLEGYVQAYTHTIPSDLDDLNRQHYFQVDFLPLKVTAVSSFIEENEALVVENERLRRENDEMRKAFQELRAARSMIDRFVDKYG